MNLSAITTEEQKWPTFQKSGGPALIPFPQRECVGEEGKEEPERLWGPQSQFINDCGAMLTEERRVWPTGLPQINNFPVSQ